MKRLANSFGIAFSMYSRIPMMRCDWTEETMKYVMCFFPWIGAVIGALCFGWYHLASWLSVDAALAAIVLMMIPVFVTGGIHLDGMLDTADALSSWRPLERRIEILKDSHAGAFAIITCVVYFFLLYGVTHSIDTSILPVYAFTFVVSRSLSGFAVVTFPKMKKEGTVADFSKKAETKRIQITLICYLVIAFALMIWINPWYGIAGTVGALLTFAYYHYMAMKNFGGINGDLAGWFLSMCELIMPACMVAVQLIRMKI